MLMTFTHFLVLVITISLVSLVLVSLSDFNYLFAELLTNIHTNIPKGRENSLSWGFPGILHTGVYLES